ncbi:MAG TPA: hypothetical protein VGP15_13515 [Burkholderiales bacterium]|nr:hypothetical protein [Burkholderiales bacterium]
MASIHSSLAKGLAKVSLRDLAEMTAVALTAPTPRFKAARRKLRSAMLDDYAARLWQTSFYLFRDPSPGYGGVLTYLTLLPVDEYEAAIHSAVKFGRRSDNQPLGDALGPTITLSRHCLERLHQRLAVGTLEELMDSLRADMVRALLLAWCAVRGVEKMPLRQLSIPMLDGALRCDVVDDDALALKTFVREPSLRERRLLDDIEAWFSELDTPPSEILLLPYYLHTAEEFKAKSREHQRALDGFIASREAAWNIFRKHDWLWEKYQRRDDPDKEAWDSLSSGAE